MSKYTYDLDLIKDKIKQYAVLLLVLIILFIVLIFLKKLYLINLNNKYNETVTQEHLGTIEEDTQTKKIKLNQSYKKGNIAGNLQLNLEQGNSTLSNIANAKSQLAFHDDIVFKSKLTEKQYILSIENEKNNEILFENKSLNKNKSLIALDGYYIFVRVTDKGDRLMAIDKNMSNIADITPSILVGTKNINSVITDGNHIYVTDGMSLYKMTLSGENLTKIIDIKNKARIIGLNDNKIFLDDGYDLSVVNLENKNIKLLYKHNFSDIVAFYNDNIMIIDSMGSKEIILINSDNNEKVIKNSEGTLTFILDGKDIYVAIANILYNLDTGEKILEAEKFITNVYRTNNFIYAYDLTGNEYKVRAK